MPDPGQRAKQLRQRAAVKLQSTAAAPRQEVHDDSDQPTLMSDGNTDYRARKNRPQHGNGHGRQK